MSERGAALVARVPGLAAAALADNTAEARGRATLARRALGLAVTSLILAGCFSLAVVIGRMPVLSDLIADPQFFKRCLVIHVDLALIVWFFAFAAGLFALLPGSRRADQCFAAGFAIALAGVGSMVVGALFRGTTPVLANYVPVIDHPLFIAGLVLFFVGLLVCFGNGRLFRDEGVLPVDDRAGSCEVGPGSFRISPDAAAGLKTVALAYMLAMTTFVVSWVATPYSPELKAYYELVFWGGGHVLQVANVAAMLAVWLMLVSSLLRRPVVSARTAWLLFGLLLAPHLIAPLLTLQGTLASMYRIGFTRLMQFGIFPVVTIFLVICVRRLKRAFRDGTLGRDALRDPRFIGFCASALLTVAGFLVGASIRGTSTMIPAHYHASIGAVTVAFMAVSYVLLEPLGLRLHPALRGSRREEAQIAPPARNHVDCVRQMGAITVVREPLPHPGPLPLGEGGRQSGLAAIERERLDGNSRAMLPLPAGEGGGEGERIISPSGLQFPPNSSTSSVPDRVAEHSTLQRSQSLLTSAATNGWLVPLQLCLFGFGQFVFALGFGWAGLYGLGRKAYGAEQHVRTLGEYIGLGVMGVGGLIAIAGGLLYLALMIRAARPLFRRTFSRIKIPILVRNHA
ncbi:MAG: hypothetical protein HYY24_19710 [Verrucomicrobia bacterium]|nr:hypothetical protein [Verrucomicrobiota bacterium]